MSSSEEQDYNNPLPQELNFYTGDDNAELVGQYLAFYLRAKGFEKNSSGMTATHLSPCSAHADRCNYDDSERITYNGKCFAPGSDDPMPGLAFRAAGDSSNMLSMPQCLEALETLGLASHAKELVAEFDRGMDDEKTNVLFVEISDKDALSKATDLMLSDKQFWEYLSVSSLGKKYYPKRELHNPMPPVMQNPYTGKYYWEGLTNEAGDIIPFDGLDHPKIVEAKAARQEAMNRAWMDESANALVHSIAQINAWAEQATTQRDAMFAEAAERGLTRAQLTAALKLAGYQPTSLLSEAMQKQLEIPANTIDGGSVSTGRTAASPGVDKTRPVS